MRAVDIAKIQILFSKEDIDKMAQSTCKGAHESMTRAYHIVEKVKELLAVNTPPIVIAEMIEIMEGK